VSVRHEMLEEAVEIIRGLWAGSYVTKRGRHFQVDSARLWDVPEQPPPIGIAVSGRNSCALAGRLGDLMISTEPQASLVQEFDRRGGSGKPRVGQVPVCYDEDRDAAVKRAHAQFRWFNGGWKVNSELPGTAAFAAASAAVKPEDVAQAIPCGNDVDAFVEAVLPFAQAGFTEVALVQIGGDQQRPFLDWAETELLPALRQL
jgi:G6PDH family F420-dependent oxidoreductase